MSALTYFDMESRDNPENHIYFPAEIALVKFNLVEGILDTNCWRIAHGLKDFTSVEIYNHASFRSEDREMGHGIPIKQDEEVVNSVGLKSDWVHILNDLTEKLRKEKRFFVYSEDYNMVQGCLKWLKSKQTAINKRSTTVLSEEKVACFEDLVAAYLKFGRITPNQCEIDQEINPEPWRARVGNQPSSLCGFHKTSERKNCAVSHAKRLLYAFYDYFEENGRYGIETGQSHIPDGCLPRKPRLPVRHSDEFGVVPGPAEDGLESFDELDEELYLVHLSCASGVSKEKKKGSSIKYVAPVVKLVDL